jgi:ABC-type polysaccharide/polyol phosphate transport system ATPase subunit
MKDPVVRFDRVWKKFRRGERHNSLRDLIPFAVAGIFRRRPGDALGTEEFWALRDVSFEVATGEALGILGPNGAGKSTTLKLLTRILRPSVGRSEVRGRVGALIEVAAGFHPDLTGRENIYLQGAIMGMRRAEIARKFDEIVDFAGMGEFIDTPVKRYSSGMGARLGFSIAAHFDPDVLVIDEVLSVGDMEFQRRCIDRMRDFKRKGVIIVFVSHNLQAMATLCDRALYLNSAVRSLGPTHEVIESYVRASGGASGGEQSPFRIDARLLDRRGAPVQVVSPGEPLVLRATYTANEEMADLHLGFLLFRSTDGLMVHDSHFGSSELGISFRAGDQVTLDFAFRAHLTRGQYHVGAQIYHLPTQRMVGRVYPAATLTVEETRTFGGVADVELTARVLSGSRGSAAGAAGFGRTSEPATLAKLAGR